jgi:hypothetical protein
MPTMKTVELTIYKFEELNDKAKDRAREWYRNGHDFFWCDESIDSIKTFCNHFGVRLTNWSIGAHSPYSYDVDCPPSIFRGLKLKDVDRNAMPTGYCLDCALWFTFYDTFKATGCASKAFEAAIDQAFKDWRADMESQLEDEYIDEHLTANDYDFTEDGTIF